MMIFQSSLHTECFMTLLLIVNLFIISVEPSFQYIGGLEYEPTTQVTDANAIDLDQHAIESQLNLQTAESLSRALDVYQEGAFSRSYAELALVNPISSHSRIYKGSTVVGVGTDGNKVRGRLFETYSFDSPYIAVQYETSDIQVSYVNCQVGANPDPNFDGCFASAGTIKIDGVNIDEGLLYVYDPATDNSNGRTIQGFSIFARQKFYPCESCSFEDYQKYVVYYGAYDYADMWIQAAAGGLPTEYLRGNVDFSSYTLVGRIEAFKKGTVLMNIWMAVIGEMEKSLSNCRGGREDNIDALHKWDMAVAYYTGSMEDVNSNNNINKGNLLYALANKRCYNFGTCQENGMAFTNIQVMTKFKEGQQELLNRNCSKVQEIKERIVQLMVVPLIQTTLQYAHRLGIEYDPKSAAAGATAAAAILPLVHNCNIIDADIIYQSMMTTVVTDPAALDHRASRYTDNNQDTAIVVDFLQVKAALERNYMCIGISCDEVGGLIDYASSGKYFTAAAPCGDFQPIGNFNDEIPTRAPTTNDPIISDKIVATLVPTVPAITPDQIMNNGDATLQTTTSSTYFQLKVIGIGGCIGPENDVIEDGTSLLLVDCGSEMTNNDDARLLWSFDSKTGLVRSKLNESYCWTVRNRSRDRMNNPGGRLRLYNCNNEVSSIEQLQQFDLSFVNFDFVTDFSNNNRYDKSAQQYNQIRLVSNRTNDCVVYQGANANIGSDPILIKKCNSIQHKRTQWHKI